MPLVEPKKKRTLAEARKREKCMFAYKLRLEGKSAKEIGEVMGVSEVMARNYCRQQRLYTEEELQKCEGRAGVIHQFEVLQQIQDKALEDYEKSKNKVKQQTVEIQKANQGGGMVTIQEKGKTVETEKIGDPRYLSVALKANEQICALLGLDAPKVQEIIHTVNESNDDELRARIGKMTPEQQQQEFMKLMRKP